MAGSHELTNDDFVIVLGDFGIWNKYAEFEKQYLDELAAEPFTTVFVDGNHENFDRLESGEFETVDFHGGKAHKIRENIYHLIRGYVFEFCGKKFFAFGGAKSHDIRDGVLNPEDYLGIDEAMAEAKKWHDEGKQFRIKGLTWWPQEMPNEEEMMRGRQILAENNNKVDYIVTHCCPYTVVSVFSRGFYKADNLTAYFDEIAQEVEFDRWYFGHYHNNQVVMGKFIMKYEDVERVV